MRRRIAQFEVKKTTPPPAHRLVTLYTSLHFELSQLLVDWGWPDRGPTTKKKLPCACARQGGENVGGLCCPNTSPRQWLPRLQPCMWRFAAAYCRPKVNILSDPHRARISSGGWASSDCSGIGYCTEAEGWPRAGRSMQAKIALRAPFPPALALVYFPWTIWHV